MDREVRDPLDILDEVERELGMPCCAMTRPGGPGQAFGGIINPAHAEHACSSRQRKAARRTLKPSRLRENRRCALASATIGRPR